MNELKDTFGRTHTYLRISVTDRCNLRCLYCMPKDGIKWKKKDEILTFEEITRLANIFVSMGINKIRITGGEPTLRNGIENLIQDLSKLKGLKTLAMTTNGVLLKNQIFRLKESGLNSLNISLDTLKADRFQKISLIDNFYNVLDGIYAALEAGFHPLKLNVVVMGGINEDEILEFIKFAKDKPINIRFIEYMPFKDNGWGQAKLYPYSKMLEQINRLYTLIPIQSETSSVAKDFYIKDFKGTVSFITSMTDSFCATCNRLRLTADGYMKSCLFYLPEMNLRNLLRSGISDEILKDVIRGVVLGKKKGHPEIDELEKHENTSMIQIGG